MAGRALARITEDIGVVPQLWWYEVRNTLIVSERRGRLTPVDTSGFLRDLGDMLIEVDQEPSDASVLALARTHTLTVYDAAYLELAIRRGLPLATLDKDLLKAAKKERVPLL